MDDTERGLYRKYQVHRTDGSIKHDGCSYFVLDVSHDPFAKDALRAYALACRKDYPQLADDLEAALEAGDPAEAIKKLF